VRNAALAAALLSVLAVSSMPYTPVLVLGGVFGLALLLIRPDITFALYFAVMALFEEDVLLHTEELAQTIYRVPLPYIGINIFELVLVGLVAATVLQRGGRFYGTRLDFSILFYAAMCLFGYLVCIALYGDPTRLFEPRRLLHFFLTYFLTVNLLRSKEALQMFLLIYFSGLVLQAWKGVYMYLGGSGLMIKWKIRAIFTGWGDSLNFVTFMLFLAVFILEKAPLRFKRFFILMLPAVFFSFLFSYKRAYYVALAAGLGILFLMQGARARMRLFVIVLVSSMIMVLVIIGAGQGEAFARRAGSIFTPIKESSAYYRIIEWRNALISIEKHPLTGIGLGGVMPMEIYLPRTNLLGVHNTYLWVAVKMGLLGLFAYLLLHFTFFRQLIRQNSRLTDPYLRAVSKGVTCAFTAFCAAQMFAPMFSQMRTSTWMGVMLGIGMMLGHYDQQEKEQSKPNPELQNNRQT